MTLEEKKLLYTSLLHAMQSGIEYNKQDPFEREHKHLRVGINAALSDNAALVSLLMEKGIFTEDEYLDKLIEFMEREVKRYEEILSKSYRANIKLG